MARAPRCRMRLASTWRGSGRRCQSCGCSKIRRGEGLAHAELPLRNKRFKGGPHAPLMHDEPLSGGQGYLIFAANEREGGAFAPARRGSKEILDLKVGVHQWSATARGATRTAVSSTPQCARSRCREEARAVLLALQPAARVV
jgi:hypothetical protein